MIIIATNSAIMERDFTQASLQSNRVVKSRLDTQYHHQKHVCPHQKYHFELRLLFQTSLLKSQVERPFRCEALPRSYHGFREGEAFRRICCEYNVCSDKISEQ